MVPNLDQTGRASSFDHGSGHTDRAVAIQVLMETGLEAIPARCCLPTLRRSIERKLPLLSVFHTVY